MCSRKEEKSRIRWGLVGSCFCRHHSGDLGASFSPLASVSLLVEWGRRLDTVSVPCRVYLPLEKSRGDTDSFKLSALASSLCRLGSQLAPETRESLAGTKGKLVPGRARELGWAGLGWA